MEEYGKCYCGNDTFHILRDGIKCAKCGRIELTNPLAIMRNYCDKADCVREPAEEGSEVPEWEVAGIQYIERIVAEGCTAAAKFAADLQAADTVKFYNAQGNLLERDGITEFVVYGVEASGDCQLLTLSPCKPEEEVFMLMLPNVGVHTTFVNPVAWSASKPIEVGSVLERDGIKWRCVAEGSAEEHQRKDLEERADTLKYLLGEAVEMFSGVYEAAWSATSKLESLMLKYNAEHPEAYTQIKQESFKKLSMLNDWIHAIRKTIVNMPEVRMHEPWCDLLSPPVIGEGEKRLAVIRSCNCDSPERMYSYSDVIWRIKDAQDKKTSLVIACGLVSDIEFLSERLRHYSGVRFVSHKMKHAERQEALKGQIVIGTLQFLGQGIAFKQDDLIFYNCGQSPQRVRYLKRSFYGRKILRNIKSVCSETEVEETGSGTAGEK